MERKNVFSYLVLLALVLLVLACGPATQSASESAAIAQPGPQKSESTLEGTAAAQPPAQDSDATATPAPTPTPRYPKLDATLQEVVQRFEDEELSESEAAALVYAHRGNSIIVEIHFSDDAEAFITVDTWIGDNDVDRTYVVDDTPPSYPSYIIVFVPVSRLGDLSQQEGVGWVTVLRRAPVHAEIPPPPTPTYPKIRDSYLQEVVARLDEGQITESQAQDELSPGGLYAMRESDSGDSTLFVDVLLSANLQDVAAWLRDREVSPEVHEHEAGDGVGGINANVPLSLLGTLSQQEGVEAIRTSIPWFLDSQ